MVKIPSFVVGLIASFLAVTVYAKAFELMDEDTIKCKVCLRAVEHMWHRGVILREKCAHPSRELEQSHECDLSNIQHKAIQTLVQGTCEELPRSYQALMHSEFEMVLHDNPNHSTEVAQAITDACVKFVHDAHTVESVALLVYSNLDARKHTNEILYPLQQRFCQVPCNMKKPLPRKARPTQYQERHEDYTYAIAVEEGRQQAEAEEAAKKVEEVRTSLDKERDEEL